MSTFADADGPGWRQRQRRRDADLEFLAKVRALREARDLQAIMKLENNHVKAPAWKRVCLERAFKFVCASLMSELMTEDADG